MKLAIAALLLVGFRQVLPPPPIVPPEFQQPVNGYELAVPYALWGQWIESRKGEVIDAVLTQAPSGEQMRWMGDPIVEFRMHGDFGRYSTGHIRRYCAFDPVTQARGACGLQLRRAHVPLPAMTYGETNPVADWMRSAFDPIRLTAHWREIGLPPSTDWWLADGAAMFAVLPSPVPVLREHAKLVTLDGAQCPEMVAALEAIDASTVDWRTDLYGIGEDSEPPPPRPHAVFAVFTLRFDVGGASATVTGSDPTLQSMVQPVLEAAERCEGALGATGS